jgi:hypothetical protein
VNDICRDVGNQLHVPSTGKTDFGKRFGNTVTQEQLVETTSRLDGMLLSATMPSGKGSVDFKYLMHDGESAKDEMAAKNRMFHTFQQKDLLKEAYNYRQDGIVGVTGR